MVIMWSVELLWSGVCDSNDVCDGVPNGGALCFGLRPRAIDSLLSLMKNFSRSRPTDRVQFGSGAWCPWFCMSSVAEVSAFAHRFPFRDVGEYTETYVHGAGAPKVVSAKHASVDGSSFDLVHPEFGNLRAGSKTHMADASGQGATADLALVGAVLGGAVGPDHEGNDKARKGGRGQRRHLSQ